MNLTSLELLSPARNVEYGKVAIDHGADAVYIGAPKFGARQAAGNSLPEIEELVQYAHLFKAKVYVTLNTLLYGHELPEAEKLISQLYAIGVDALIIQDLGLLELDLPPIPLHASTQTHNISPEKVLFFEKQGFERVILARELSLAEIAEIRKQTQIQLEAFVHGSLCVCYSGQCYMSQYITGRSGNRGECAQPCRSAYDLYNSEQLLVKSAHLLSLKDFNASQQIEDLCKAGISSFKIEGRLKDKAYLKNTTAYYRQQLDTVIAKNPQTYKKASSGEVRFYFQPDIDRTFNRGYTSYFLSEREKNMASFDTQKSIGKELGTVEGVYENYFTITTPYKISNGDGFCFFEEKQLQGFLVNKVEGDKIYPNRFPENLKKGTTVYRNNDVEFEKQLEKKTAERKIEVTFLLKEIEGGFSLKAIDTDDYCVEEQMSCEKQPAQDASKADETIRKQLSKLGDTAFELTHLELAFSQPFFIPISILNALRRGAIEKMQAERMHRELPVLKRKIQDNTPLYCGKDLDYRANILNEKSAAFYTKQGVKSYEQGFEIQNKGKGTVLMTTKYCIRYEMKQCPVYFSAHPDYLKPLFLRNINRSFALEFDCKNCLMKIKAT